MGLKKITSVKQLLEVTLGNDGEFIGNNHILYVLKCGQYERFLISDRLYNKISKAGAIWPNTTYSILRETLKTLILNSDG